MNSQDTAPPVDEKPKATEKPEKPKDQATEAKPAEEPKAQEPPAAEHEEPAQPPEPLAYALIGFESYKPSGIGVPIPVGRARPLYEVPESKLADAVVTLVQQSKNPKIQYIIAIGHNRPTRNFLGAMEIREI